MEEDFQAKSEAFMIWLSNSAANISNKIDLRDLREMDEGRGVIATADIAEEEVLFAIPRNVVLSAENSNLYTKCPEAFENLGPWLSLILVMIYEYLQHADSKWKPYFDILPTEFDTLMFWSEDELAWLEASAVRNKVGKESADAEFNSDLIPTLRRYGLDVPQSSTIGSGRLSDQELLGLAHRMGSIIMAYAFDIERVNNDKVADEEGYVSEDEDEMLPKGMVPLADMLNADADRNNARLFYEDEVLMMKALKPIKAGEELFNDYGPLPRSDLLRRYGYITNNYAKYDVVEVSFELVRQILTKGGQVSDTVFDARLDYLEEQDVIDTGFDIAVADDSEPLENISPELIVLIEASLLSQPDFDRMKSKGKLPKPNKFTPTCARMLFEIVKARSAEYPTTLESEFQEPLPSEARHRMAKQIRMGEKTILKDTEKILKELVEELEQTRETRSRGMETSQESKPSKRRKVA